MKLTKLVTILQPFGPAIIVPGDFPVSLTISAAVGVVDTLTMAASAAITASMSAGVNKTETSAAEAAAQIAALLDLVFDAEKTGEFLRSLTFASVAGVESSVTANFPSSTVLAVALVASAVANCGTEYGIQLQSLLGISETGQYDVPKTITAEAQASVESLVSMASQLSAVFGISGTAGIGFYYEYTRSLTFSILAQLLVKGRLPINVILLIQEILTKPKATNETLTKPTATSEDLIN